MENPANEKKLPSLDTFLRFDELVFFNPIKILIFRRTAMETLFPHHMSHVIWSWTLLPFIKKKKTDNRWRMMAPPRATTEI